MVKIQKCFFAQAYGTPFHVGEYEFGGGGFSNRRIKNKKFKTTP